MLKFLSQKLIKYFLSNGNILRNRLIFLRAFDIFDLIFLNSGKRLCYF